MSLLLFIFVGAALGAAGWWMWKAAIKVPSTHTLTAPQVIWNPPASIVKGTPLSDAQLNATSNVEGVFVYNPPAGKVLSVGSHDLLATFHPTESAKYMVYTQAHSIVVTPAPKAVRPPAPTQTKIPSKGLEIVDFNSVYGVTLSNDSNGTLFVLDVVATLAAPENDSISLPVQSELGPLKTQEYKFNVVGTFSTLEPEGDTWEDQYHAAKQANKGCFVPLFVTPSSSWLQQVKDAFQSGGKMLQVGEASGVISYRTIEGKIIKQPFPLKVVLTKANGCTP